MNTDKMLGFSKATFQFFQTSHRRESETILPFLESLCAQVTSSLLLILLLLGNASSQQTKPADRTAEIDRIVTEQMEMQQVPGMTVAVTENGHLVYSKAFGTADLENNVPIRTETLIRTGSIAKPLTAVAAMTLVETGKLDLDVPVQKYVRPFPKSNGR